MNAKTQNAELSSGITPLPTLDTLVQAVRAFRLDHVPVTQLGDVIEVLQEVQKHTVAAYDTLRAREEDLEKALQKLAEDQRALTLRVQAHDLKDAVVGLAKAGTSVKRSWWRA